MKDDQRLKATFQRAWDALTKTATNQVTGKPFVWSLEGQNFECAVSPWSCPTCLKPCLVALPPPLLAAQEDDTTHVCHPVLGGCGGGFRVED